MMKAMIINMLKLKKQNKQKTLKSKKLNQKEIYGGLRENKKKMKSI